MPVVPVKRGVGGVCEGNSTTQGPPMGSDPETARPLLEFRHSVGEIPVSARKKIENTVEELYPH